MLLPISQEMNNFIMDATSWNGLLAIQHIVDLSMIFSLALPAGTFLCRFWSDFKTDHHRDKASIVHFLVDGQLETLAYDPPPPYPSRPIFPQSPPPPLTFSSLAGVIDCVDKISCDFCLF